MDAQLFEDLKDSLQQAKAIRQGKLEGRRTTVIPIDVKAVREQAKLSQGEFAAAMRVSVRTLQNWEQRRRSPTGPAAALLKVMATAPAVVIKALHQ
ncbi:NadS family protein [Castellaniella sp.]|uniref:NadS family protein n=1 Tax=Castellaniella sp. TaxID=1955812 RepID=UPI002AFE3CAB|nr:NadS family protein [Castellaniella sp.]